MDKKPEERRKDLRLGIGSPLTLSFRIKKNKGLFKLQPKQIFQVDNMSLGGISVELPPLDQKQLDRVKNGLDQLVVELKISYLKKPLKLPGKIAWLQKKDKDGKPTYIAGLSFNDLSDSDRDKLLSQLIGICLKTKVII